MKNTKHILILAFLTLTMLNSCKKKEDEDKHTPPTMEFKTGGAYTSGDKTVNKLDTLLVGITATKTEDDLKSYNASFTYDGGTTGTTFFNYVLSSTEKGSYSNDLKIITRNQAGTEKWVFTIADRDGNITQKTINLTVH